MNKKIKHSPLKNKPLRNPGQSLDEKIQVLLYEDVYHYIVVIFIFIILAILEWVRHIFNTPPAPLLWTLVALVAIVYYARKIKKSLNEIKNMRLGRDGEKIVGQSLEKIRMAGYKVFHDIVDTEKKFNIDHIIVGPAGVFTIETKTISKTGGVQNIKWDGDKIKIDGFVPDRDPIAQAKAQAQWLQDFISDSTGIKIYVKPVVIYPGWFVEPQPRGADVWVLNEKALPSFLRNETPVLKEDRIDFISAQIAKYNKC